MLRRKKDINGRMEKNNMMRSDVLMVLKVSMLGCYIASELVTKQQRFQGTYCFHLQS